MAIDSMLLHKLARDKSEGGRKKFAESISDIFAQHYPTLSPRERELIFDILARLVHDMEMALRRVVSEHLAALPDVPRNLAKVLAYDAIEVAFPILSQTPVLLDEDLVEVIQQRSMEHQLAITVRPAISEGISDALVQAGNEGVIRSLLMNPNAKISSATINYLVEESRRVTSYQEPLLSRHDLEPQLAKRMFTWVSAALRQFILDNYDLDRAYLDEALEKSVMEELKSVKRYGSGSAARKLAAELKKQGKVTPDLLISALQEGEIRLFQSMFQQLTDLNERIVMNMMAEPLGTGLAVACRHSGLGRAIYSSIFAIVHKARGMTETKLHADLRKAVRMYDQISAEAADKVVARWRQRISYRTAISELELK
jgi:uncharacterized protein (DUF2336 family)